jgi:hypothetical protein
MLNFFAGLIQVYFLISDALLFIMVMTSALPSPANYYKAVSTGIILLGFAHGLAGMINIALMGIEIIPSIPFSALTIVQSIQVGGFIYGLQIFIMIPYAFIEYSKIAMYLYGSWTT